MKPDPNLTASLRDFAAQMDAMHAGHECEHCGEFILPGEAAENYGPHFHRECLFRQVAGSVGHLNGRCSCHGGTESDPAGMSRREAARAALALWRAKEKGRPAPPGCP